MAEQTLSLGPHAGAFYQLGWARDATGFRVEALAAYDQALRLYRADHDRGNEAATLSSIGLVYANLGQRQQALDHYQQALPITREVGNRAGEAATLNNIGLVYDNLGQQQALDHYQQALPITREVGDRAGEAVTRYNIAMSHWHRGELDHAISELERVVDLDRQVDHPDLQSDTAMLDRLRHEHARSDPPVP